MATEVQLRPRLFPALPGSHPFFTGLQKETDGCPPQVAQATKHWQDVLSLCNSVNPSPVPVTIPLCVKNAIGRTVAESTTTGATVIKLLDGREKAIICPWFGDNPWADDASYDPGRGDGRHLYCEPGDDFFSPLPPALQASNIRMAVPLWVLKFSAHDSMTTHKATTLAVGAIHPLHGTALVCMYRDGLLDGPQMLISGRDFSRVSPSDAQKSLIEISMCGGQIGPFPLRAPVWSPRI